MDKQTESKKIVRHHVIWSLGGGLVPVPLLDIAAVSLIQIDMIKQLCRLYEVDYSESRGKAILSTVTGGALARLGTSVVKTIPGIGTLLGTVSMPILSGASTYALAQAVILHFESGGNLFDLDMEMIKQVYKENLNKGKKFASELQKEQKSDK